MKDGNKKSTPRRVVIYALLLAAAIAGGIAAKAFDFRELSWPSSTVPGAR